MCPLKVIPRIFVFDEEELPAELRSQRVLNRTRIPEISNYLSENPRSYIFSSITASIDGEAHFEPFSEAGPASNAGKLLIPMDAKFLINDGQHRRAAIGEALKSTPELGDESLSIVLFRDAGLKRSQQMFADLNRHSIRPTTSIGILYDRRDPLSQLSRFGCWVCTVVEQDHSMESMIDNGEDWMQPLLDFRDEISSHQDPKKKRQVREFKRRNGRVTRKKEDGTLIPGPYKLDIRRKLLRQLLEAQESVRRDGPDPKATLISEDELREIRRFWLTEKQDWEDTLPKIYEEVTGKCLECVSDDVGNFTIKDKELLKEVASKHDIDPDLIAKLLDVERELHGMSRRAGIFGRIHSIFQEDWLTEEEQQGLYEPEEDEVNV